jgi:hypothetical protein
VHRFHSESIPRLSEMDIIICDRCGTRVIPNADGSCPSCRMAVLLAPASGDPVSTHVDTMNSMKRREAPDPRQPLLTPSPVRRIPFAFMAFARMLLIILLACASLILGAFGMQMFRAGIRIATGNSHEGFFASMAMQSPTATIVGGIFHLMLAGLCLIAIGKLNPRLNPWRFLTR